MIAAVRMRRKAASNFFAVIAMGKFKMISRWKKVTSDEDG